MKQEDIARIQKTAQKAADEWLAEHGSDEKVAAAIRRLLDSQVEKIVSCLVGFESRWSTWEIDRCNGRESQASKWLESKAGEEVRRWLAEQAGNLPKLPKAAVAALHRYYHERLKRATEEALGREAVRQTAFLTREILAKETGVSAAETEDEEQP